MKPRWSSLYYLKVLFRFNIIGDASYTILQLESCSILFRFMDKVPPFSFGHGGTKCPSEILYRTETKNKQTPKQNTKQELH